VGSRPVGAALRSEIVTILLGGLKLMKEPLNTYPEEKGHKKKGRRATFGASPWSAGSSRWNAASERWGQGEKPRKNSGFVENTA